MIELPDLSKFDEICDHDQKCKRQMISILKREFPKEKNSFYELFKANKYKDTAAVVHKLKHKIHLLNLEEGYAVASEFEHQLLHNTTELFNHFVNILDTIEQFLKTI